MVFLSKKVLCELFQVHEVIHNFMYESVSRYRYMNDFKENITGQDLFDL